MRQLLLLRGQIALVDDMDYPSLARYHWRLNSSGYAIRSVCIDGREMVFCMHREIMRAEPGQYVDHIDHDRLNNQRANLRLVTQQQNLMNRRRGKNNTSGFKGVTRFRGQWQARIQLDEQSIHLGLFDDPIAAAQAYDCAALRLFGAAYATLNFPDDAPPAAVTARVVAALGKRGSA